MTDVTIPSDVAKNEAEHLRFMADEFLALQGRTRNGEALRALADLLDPQPPTLREQVALALAIHHQGWEWPEYADAVLAVVADWLAAQPHTTESWSEMYGEQKAQRDHDVRLIRGGGIDG